MKAWIIDGQFGIDHLRLVDRDVPPVTDTQVLVRIKACSLNYRDLRTVKGTYNPKQPLPLVPLSDGVGVVEAVGSQVTRVKVGQRVALIFAQNWLSGNFRREFLSSTLGGPLSGTLAEYVAVNAEGVVAVPNYLTDEEAATLGCAGVTAWNAVITEGNIHAGKTVLLLGTGGVSMFALQFAKLMGARAIVTSSSDDKLEKARALGADELINYREMPKWSKKVQQLTNGCGVDLVVEVGGAGTFAESMASAKASGVVALIGVLSGNETAVNLISILMHHVRVQGILVGSRDDFEAMNEAAAFHKLRPVIDKNFAFGDVVSAFRHLESGSHFGKITLSGSWH